MLAYAEARQRIGERRSSPSTFLLIVGAHVAVVAVAMSVKMVVDQVQQPPPTTITFVPIKQPPPPVPDPPRADPSPLRPPIDQPVTLVPRPDDISKVDASPTPVPMGELTGNDFGIPVSSPQPLPIPDPVRTGPHLATPASALKPPYPASRLETQQEAALRLRLSIDERGRVVAVEPAGPVDKVFFEAARRHLLARWRYQPATVDGKAVASTTVITLRFELEG